MNGNFNNIKVSIIVPSYNVENYIRKCLSSIVNQTLKEIQIICVNDGSVDTTLTIISEFAEKDNRIVVINKSNSGYGDSLNIAMSEATGEYIGIVESDDFIEPKMFETLYNKAKEYDADVVKSNFWLYWGNEEKEEFFECVHKDECNKVIEPLLHDNGSLYNRKNSIWSAIYRRKYLAENKIHFLTTPGASFQDISFTFKVLSTTKKMVCMYEPFLHYRQDNIYSSINNVESKIPYFWEEYNEIANFINPENHGKERLFSLYCAKFYDGCIWTYESVSPAVRYPFLKVVSDKFKDILSKINPEKINFGDCWWKRRDIVRIAENPYQYHMWRNDERYDQNKGSIRYTEPDIPVGMTAYPDTYENRTQPIFSVIIPIFNVEKFLPSALESLLYQTYKDFEIICINNGSTDHSLSVIKTYSEIDKRIIIINQERSSISAARNRGIEISTGKYIVFLDGDDYLSENTFEILSKSVIENNNPDIIEYGSTPFPEFPAASKWLYDTLTTPNDYYYKIDQTTFLKNMFLQVFCWRYCIKSTFIKEHHIIFPNELIFGEDAIFVMHCLMQASGVVILSDKLYFYRHHRSDSFSNTIYKDSEQYAKLQFEILEKMLKDAFSLFGFNKSPYLFAYCSHFVEGCLNGLNQSSKKNYITKFLTLMKRYELDQCVQNCTSSRQNFYNYCLETVESGEGEVKFTPVTVASVGKNICTGCTACVNICPANAIEMKLNNEGFLYPEVDNEKCVSCGLCYSKCPSVQTAHKLSQHSEIYAAYYDDETRMKSSSGAAFTVLAKYAFSKNGVVVGAAWTEDHRVKHIIINDETELDRLRRSKYMQSDMGNIFSRVKELLAQQTFVLFSGCPCQIAGLYAYLGETSENLLTVDVVCHGVPSPLAFENYLKDIAQGRKATDINFRDKSRGWGTSSSISFSDGTKYYKGCNDDSYYIAFLNGISTRPSCGACKYASPSRMGDITLGDFWGISEIDPSNNDNKGTSLVMLNSSKGEKIFGEVRESLKLVRKVPFDTVIDLAKRRNGWLIAPRPSHKNREKFFKLMNEYSFSKAVLQAAESKFDIGVVGWWYNENYGGTLTYFALNRILKSMGYSVLMIEKPANDPKYVPNYSTIPRRFAKKYYNISKNYHPNKMGILNGICDTFISGSDQLFSPYLWEYSGPSYYLDFAAPDKNIISYASSFGNSYTGSERFRMTVSYYLRRFNAISVREDYAVGIMRDNFGLNAKKVLDPVFVCDPVEYDKLIEQSTVEIKEKYFANFLLDPDESKRNAIFYVEKQLRLPYVNLINAMDFEQNTKKLGLDSIKANADIEDFLKYYKNAEFIITDSFHGTCFAIIFRKPFIAIANKQRGTGRFVSMLGELGLQDRMVNDASDIPERPDLLQPVDYGKTEKLLKTLRDDSYNWLKNAIDHPASKAKSDFQLMDMKQNASVNRMILMRQEIDELKRKIEHLSRLLENK